MCTTLHERIRLGLVRNTSYRSCPDIIQLITYIAQAEWKEASERQLLGVAKYCGSVPKECFLVGNFYR
jgi:hypothetical protein